MTADDWIDWALAVEIPVKHEHVGTLAVRLVLLELSRYADHEGKAWPAAQTIADKIRELSRRDVRNALDVLQEAGLIVPAGKVSRARCWRIVTTNDVAVYTATSTSAEVAGQLAGEMAGESAVYTATNRTERNRTSPQAPQQDRNVPRESTRRREREDQLILQDLAAKGLDLEESQAVMEYARNDPQTIAPRQRLQQGAYLSQCRQAVRAKRAVAYDAGDKCLDHPTEVAANCRSCQADVKCGERERRFIGQRQPRCRQCYEPIIGMPQGAEYCRDCAEGVTA